MDFSVVCACGTRLTVAEAMAGTHQQCRCGRTVPVPSLSELKGNAGLARYDASPVHLIQHMALAGELPPPGPCCHCGRPTEEALRVSAECEKAWTRGGGENNLALALLFGVWVLLGRRTKRELGTNTIVPVPVKLCPDCKQEYVGRSSVLALRFVEVISAAAALVVTLAWSPWGLLLLLITGLAECLVVSIRERQRAALKKCLREVPVYSELLKRYPSAIITWAD